MAGKADFIEDEWKAALRTRRRRRSRKSRSELSNTLRESPHVDARRHMFGISP